MSSSADYWRKRSEDRFKAAERTVEAQQEDLTRFFDDALKDTQVVIRDFWARYAKDNKISYAEAQQLLNFEELREFKDDLKSFEQLAKSSIGTFNLELENLSTKSRITRYQALETQLKAVMENLTGKTEKMIQDTAGKVCEDSFYKTLFDADQYRGYHEDFVGLDEDLIREIISQPVAGATFSQSIWRNQQNLNYRVRQTLTDAMATGRNPYELSKDFAKEFNVGRYEAYRLLYTESAAVHTDAQMRAYKADGVTQYEIVATLDSKTSKICQEMDGKQFDVDKAQKGKNCPPFHPWCRTTTAPVIEELEETGTRAARSKTTGKTEKVLARMKYKDWKEKFGKVYNYSPKTSKEIFELVEDKDKFKEVIAAIDSANEKFDMLFPDSSTYLNAVVFTGDEAYLSQPVENTISTVIRLSPKWEDVKNAFQELTKESKHIATTEPMSIYAHEYGHFIVDAIALKKTGFELNGPMNSIMRLNYDLHLKNIRQHVVDEYFAPNAELISSKISDRAADSVDEFIAESFSQYFYGESSSDLARNVVEYLMKEWRKV